MLNKLTSILIVLCALVFQSGAAQAETIENPYGCQLDYVKTLETYERGRFEISVVFSVSDCSQAVVFGGYMDKNGVFFFPVPDVSTESKLIEGIEDWKRDFVIAGSFWGSKVKLEVLPKETAYITWLIPEVFSDLECFESDIKKKIYRTKISLYHNYTDERVYLMSKPYQLKIEK